MQVKCRSGLQNKQPNIEMQYFFGNRCRYACIILALRLHSLSGLSHHCEKGASLLYQQSKTWSQRSNVNMLVAYSILWNKDNVLDSSTLIYDLRILITAIIIIVITICIFLSQQSVVTLPPQPFYGPFPGPPGWASARRQLLDFMVQGKINRDRHTDHPAGRHSIWTHQCPPAPFFHFFTSRMPFLLPNQQCQITEGN